MEMDSLIVRRTFDLHLESGAASLVRVGIDLPRAVSDNWACRIYIDGSEDNIVREFYGIDSLQVTLIALNALKFEVEVLQRRYGSKITFLGDSDLWTSKPDVTSST